MDLIRQLNNAAVTLRTYDLEGQEGFVLIAQALNRIAEALERKQGEQADPLPEPQGPTHPPIASAWPMWRSGVCPTRLSSDDGWFEVPAGGYRATLPDGREFRVKPWHEITAGEPWAPLYLTKTFTVHRHDASVPPQEPLTPSGTPAEPEAPQEVDDGWIRDRAPHWIDGDDCGPGYVETLNRSTRRPYPVPWFVVYPGTPWRPIP